MLASGDDEVENERDGLRAAAPPEERDHGCRPKHHPQPEAQLKLDWDFKHAETSINAALTNA